MNMFCIRVFLVVLSIFLGILEELWFELWRYVKECPVNHKYKNTKNLYALYIIHLVSAIAIIVIMVTYAINPVTIASWINNSVIFLLALAYIIPVIIIWSVGLLFYLIVGTIGRQQDPKGKVS